MNHKTTQKFTAAEREVMSVLWEQGESKPAQIQEHFPRPIKNPALRSILTILCEKGHVTRRKLGKAYVYKAKTKQAKAWQNQLGDLVETYFNGSVSAMVLNLVKSEKLSAEDIEALKAYAENHETKPQDGDLS
ncbi:BlaI/MecI/CopY family transcriptional regulator [Kiritimatiellota bacterium B12222]|nr:BlaI/MecI/CopY family transcriptional regulator [Kiritimatiellota bacterium B12222]